MHLLLDGTDNFETRFLLNDAAVKHGCLGVRRLHRQRRPDDDHRPRTDALPAVPDARSAATRFDADLRFRRHPGIDRQRDRLAAVLRGPEDPQRSRGRDQPFLQVFELWDNRIRQVGLDSLREHVDCPTCQGREYPWLEGRRGSHTAVLCGRNSVQLSYPDRHPIDLEHLARKLEGVGRVSRNRFLLRLEVDHYMITVFPDGRAIVGGTDDVSQARTVHAKYIGA
jgi:molybdopterin-synthase adenylyltransferase